MKKITIGIKEGKKVVYLKTKEVKNYFEVNKLIELLEVFFKYNVERR
jgi:hypothetical protein